MWRKQHPRGTSYTWANADYSQASRLDRFLVSGSLERCIDCPKVFPCSFSDHDFVALNFSPDDCPGTRSGVWKFNSSLLNDATFKCELSQLITDQKQSMANFQTIGVWWDNLKAIIRNFCQKYCSRKRKSANCLRTSLTNRLIRAKMISLMAMHQGQFNSKSRSMLMTAPYLSKLNDLSVDFCKLLNCTNAVQELNLTPPNPRPCGLGDGGVMGLLLLV